MQIINIEADRGHIELALLIKLHLDGPIDLDMHVRYIVSESVAASQLQTSSSMLISMYVALKDACHESSILISLGI